MRLVSQLPNNQAQLMRNLSKELHKPILFRDLDSGEHFTVESSREVYKKIGNSHSVSQKTGKDAIFLLHNKVHRAHYG